MTTTKRLFRLKCHLLYFEEVVDPQKNKKLTKMFEKEKLLIEEQKHFQLDVLLTSLEGASRESML